MLVFYRRCFDVRRFMFLTTNLSKRHLFRFVVIYLYFVIILLSLFFVSAFFYLRKINNELNDNAKIKTVILEDNTTNLEQVAETIRTQYDENAIPVLVIACNRLIVVRCIENLLKLRPSAEQFPVIVSQDCRNQNETNYPATSDAIRVYSDHLFYIQQPNQTLLDYQITLGEEWVEGYYKIARHYGWVLNQTFNNFNFSSVIVIEDDIEIAVDFFEYFLGTLPILRADPTLWCVSAWNDNGKLDLIDRYAPYLLHRTDFFPGLGWMLTKNIWDELAPKWPPVYWDDWMRLPGQRKGRACIRPEISRTKTVGKQGVSNGLFFDNHLKYIHLNMKFVAFTRLNLTYLLKDNYDFKFVKSVYDCMEVSYEKLKRNKITNYGPVRISYYTEQMYQEIAGMFGLMDDFKSSVPRTGYRGIVGFLYNNQRVYLTPNVSWNGIPTNTTDSNNYQ